MLACLYQIWRIAPQVGQDLSDIRKDIGQPGLWRSANFSQNQRFANFVKFLHENIPPEARVVLPSRETGLRAASTTPFMQYFLAPREVSNCIQPVIECIAMHSNDHTYFVILDAASIQNKVADLFPKRIILFDQSWGVYLPDNAASESKSQLIPFNHASEIFLAMSGPAMWLGTLLVAGLVVAHQLKASKSWLMKASIAYGISLGFISLSALLLMLAGIPLIPPVIVFITILWFASSLFLWLATKKRELRLERKKLTGWLAIRSMDSWPVIFLFFSLIGTILSVGKGYHTSDSIVLWGAKGYGIASQGLISGASDWGTSTTRYPLHIPILIAAFKVLFGEILPASKLIFPLYYFALLGIMYAYLQTKIPRIIAGLSTLTLASIPLLFRHAQIAYANLPFTFYFLSAVLISLEAINDTSETSRNNRFLLGGIFFVLSSWTRPEGIPLTIITLLLIILLGAPQLRRTFRKTIVLWTAPMVIFSFLWFTVSGHIYVHPGQNTRLFSNALSHILRGELHLMEAGYILKYLVTELVSPSTWGVVGIGLLLFILSGIFSLGTEFFSPAVVSGLVFLVIMTGIYYLTSFDETHDISWWVSTGLNRMIMPGVVLLWVGSAESLFNRDRSP